MVWFIDRKSTYPGRYKMTDASGNTSYITLARADEPIEEGTPLNAATFNQLVHERLCVEAVLGASWSNGTQTLAVSGILESDTPHITPIYSNDAETAVAEKEAWAMVGKAEASNDAIVFTCFEDTPSVPITVQIEVIR